MYRLLAVCHTVVVDHDKDTGEEKYLASSPDELALIEGAKQIGLVLKSKTATTMTIENRTRGEPFTQAVYEMKAEFPFDSTRKRMSLMIKLGDDKYILMTKGADSIMLPRIAFKQIDG